MKQIIIPNLSIEYIGGYCEGAIESSVGLSGIYASAYRAWLANVRHTDLPPKKFYVPIYLSLPNGPKWIDGPLKGEQQGDVAISCPDGSVAAAALSGKHIGLYKYPTLQAYINDYAKANNGAIYLGWGEYIGTKKIIGENMSTKSSVTTLYQLILGRNPDTDGLKHYMTMDTDAVISDLMASAERKSYLARLAAGTKATNDKIIALTKENAMLKATPTGSTTSPSDSAAIQETNAIVKWIKDLLTRIFK